MDRSFSKKFTFFNQTRFVILILSTICLTLLLSNSIALNFTIICMVKETNDSTSNSTTEYKYSLDQQSWLFAMDPAGRIVGSFALYYVMSKLNFRQTFTLCGAVSTISTFLTPLFSSIGFPALLIIRIFQGISTGITFPSLGTIPTQWSTLRGIGMYISLLSCHLQFCNIFTMPIAGALCTSSSGWPILYYIQGGLTVFFFIIFYLFYRDNPYFHKFVSDKELRIIENGKLHVNSMDRTKKKKPPPKVPYRKLFTDWPILGNVFATTFVQIGYWLYVQFGPTYMNKVLLFDIEKTGFGAALPYVFSVVLKILAGPFVDRLKCLSLKWNLIILTIFCSGMFVIATIGISFISNDQIVFVQIVYIVAVAFAGLNGIGVWKSANLMVQHFAFIIIMTNTICISFIVLFIPMLVALIVPDNTREQWRIVFIIISAIICCGVLIFSFTARVAPRPWIKNTKHTNIVHCLSVNRLSCENFTIINR